MTVLSPPPREGAATDGRWEAQEGGTCRESQAGAAGPPTKAAPSQLGVLRGRQLFRCPVFLGLHVVHAPSVQSMGGREMTSSLGHFLADQGFTAKCTADRIGSSSRGHVEQTTASPGGSPSPQC